MLTIKLMPATIALMCPCSKYGCKPTDKILFIEENMMIGILKTLRYSFRYKNRFL